MPKTKRYAISKERRDVSNSIKRITKNSPPEAGSPDKMQYFR
ncbi:hypothetical protein SAMN05421747_116122 [Parapedobacter composti]|uniref:Uncharacterized protein n=1 Tax=Parapedobacter composti TaxID=623281 RepID=A0A1I1KP51_9SPHI|nr:hypothetical protein SAMN05421747_116122 [Parapedobacter composti]